MPASPSATEIAAVTQSCVALGSTSGSAEARRKSASGVQTPAICTQPPTTASSASTATVEVIENGPSPACE